MPTRGQRWVTAMSSDERMVFSWEGGTVSGYWHRPARGRSWVVLGHGAGGSMDSPTLVRFAEALAEQGVGAVRFNFPYAERRRRVPDPQPRLEACFRAVAGHVAGRAERLFLGGRSMGGRIASHIAAAGFPAAGLVFLGYPLHPPGQPERLRDAHLGRIEVPMLFLQGSRDSFARPDLLAQTVARLGATLHVVPEGNHGLNVRGRPQMDVLAELAAVTLEWIGRVG